MLHVPDALFRFHANNARFLQVQSPELHIYYTVETIELACRNGLGALKPMICFLCIVKEKNGQLYTIHRTHVPLLHAITDKKSQATYRAIVSELEGVLARMPGGYNRELRIILDFERAAIKAAKITVPMASVEGWAFHLARAWNRKRDQLGLRKFIRNSERCERIKRWWETLKGTIVLPPDLYRSVPALTRVPETWLEGPFKGIWNKWNKKTLRTSNIAETFHSNLLSEVRKKRLPMEKLLKVLKRMNAQSKAKLLHHGKNPDAPEDLSKKDLKRRRRVNAEMRHFEMRRARGLLWARVITTYCRRMSRFVTEKSNL
ncbi:unnamed protein product [Heligmosomoides polygyrus]|uniref:MULE domain-containing protein n=1 Tax=Heligmosomoides polygyrus TaxID=6339 RepID=A0A183GE94_HELPZ|nr:unnamed protein product [Heligmosomoides polygyrus]